MSPSNLQWYHGIVDSIRKSYSGPIDVEVEYLDVVLDADKEYLDRWFATLEQKYKNYPPDVIVTIYFPAFTFAVPNRDRIFPGCPIVYCAVPHTLGASMAKKPGLTGVVTPLDFKEPLEVIQKACPQMKKLLLISGSSSLDRWHFRIAQKRMNQLDPNIEVIDKTGLPAFEMREYLRDAGRDTVGLLLTFELDRDNSRTSTSDYFREIQDESAIPIFGLSDTELGSGLAGGAMISPTEQGEIAGKLVARILDGQSVDDVSEVLDAPLRLAFDAKVLQRYGIPENRLPKGSEIVNRQTTLWESYGKYLLTVLAALILQSAIILSLLVNRSKRLIAEKESRSLAGRILTAVEDERRYLARELHDDVSQRLAAVAIETGAMEGNCEDPKQIKASVAKLKKSLVGICDDLHRMSHRMHPSVLDDFGLRDALKSECQELSRRSSVQIDFQSVSDLQSIPKEIELCLYRVAQEALWNAVKYSKSERILVRLNADPEFVYLDVHDYGVGFDPESLNSSSGLGLASMKERVRLSNGSIKIETAPNKGVAIHVIIPLPDQENP